MSQQYSCIIIDDESHLVDLLSDLVESYAPNIQITDTCTSWTTAYKLLQEKVYDIIFLDISMQGKNGMDLLNCNPQIQSEVIFVTAHSEHALEAFKYNASGYLLKPIKDAELLVTLKKTLARLGSRIPQLATEAANFKIGIPSGNMIHYIDTDDILYMEACRSYTKVVCKQTEIVSSFNLGKFKELMPERIFRQVHRSFIINLHFVSKYDTTGVIVMANNTEIPLSKSMREEFLKQFVRLKHTNGT